MIISSSSSFVAHFLELYEIISVPLPATNFSILLLLLLLLLLRAPRFTRFRVFWSWIFAQARYIIKAIHAT
jgi:hypothetical protein